MRDDLSGVIASMLGVAIGDALGMPVEIKTPEEILNLTEGKGVTTFLEPPPNRAPWLNDLKAGDTTDDTQLTLALARSLIRRGHYDQYDCAQEFVTELDRSVCGWGGTTKKGVLELKRFFETAGLEGRSPEIPAADRPGLGTGNGVAMRIAPLGIFYGLSFKGHDRGHLLEACVAHGQLTHGDSRAVVAGYAVAALIAQLMNQEFGQVFTLKNKQELIQWLLRKVLAAEQYFNKQADNFSDRLKCLLEPEILTDPVKLRQEVGTGCFALESVPFAIATFLRNPDDFRAGLLEAVNAGGDTDTNAAIAGSLIGAYNGLAGIPTEWRNYSAKFAEVEQIANRLYEVIG